MKRNHRDLSERALAPGEELRHVDERRCGRGHHRLHGRDVHVRVVHPRECQITSVDVLVDVQGTADLTNITFNGVTQVPVVRVGPPTSKDACKHGGKHHKH